MPRFFFDISDGDHVTRDDVGRDYPDLKSARDAAVSLLPDVAREVLPDGDYRILVSTVRSHDGWILCRAMMSLVVVDVGPGRAG